MSGASPGTLAIGAAGAAIALVALVDLFVTVFNYDGFSFLANRLHGLPWKTMRNVTRPLPGRARHGTLSLGSASMLPATYVLWLALLITGFALMFYAGLRAGDFISRAGRGIGTAFYLSAGDLTSLTFGDVTAPGWLMRALVDLETVIGLTTFTLALGYVVTTFDVLRTLDALHATVRRHAEDPAKPSSILARHFAAGSRPSCRRCWNRSARSSRNTTRACGATPSSTTSTPAGWDARSRACSPASGVSWRCCAGGCPRMSR